MNNQKLIVSIYDASEVWSGFYIRAGYPVICWDKTKEGDILEGFNQLTDLIDHALEQGCTMHGFIFQPPCTDFAGSGARWWKEKDKPTEGFEPFENTTELSEALVLICFHLIDLYKPEWWVLENPVGRIHTRVPELAQYRAMIFDPCDFGDAYTKRTVLYGSLNTGLQRNPVEPEFIIWAGKKFPKIYEGTGGGSEKSKAKRSLTPSGFANAFFQANQ